MSCCSDRDFACFDRALRGFDCGNRSVRAPDAGDGAVLNDVDARAIGRTSETPCHRVVAGDTASRLERSAEHGITTVEIDDRNDLFHLLATEQLGVYSV